MNTLWTFGDSFTFGHGCRLEGPLTEYCSNYKKEDDDVWPNHLGNLLNTKVKNFGECGASNDFIIDSIIDNWDDISENDIVIIGVTYHNRIDVPIHDKLQAPFIDEDFLNNNVKYDEEQIQTLINFQYHFTYNKLYKVRHLKRFDFLVKELKKKKITTFVWDVEYMQYTTRFEKIATATNDKISDYHFSFKGHKDFADMVYKKIINPTLI
jgi:hypothetical protein